MSCPLPLAAGESVPFLAHIRTDMCDLAQGDLQSLLGDDLRRRQGSVEATTRIHNWIAPGIQYVAEWFTQQRDNAVRF